MDRPPSSADVLRRMARTFALSLRALPASLRAPIETAYLIARAADTVTDRLDASSRERKALVAALSRASRETADRAAPALTEEIATLGEERDGLDEAERALLTLVPELLRRLAALDQGDRADVSAVIETLLAAMQREIERFENDVSSPAVPSGTALTAYTEGIAGCVGAFWTRLLARHACRWSPARARARETAARRYGRGLQLVNVLRDLPEDLSHGRCHLPADELAACGMRAEDLLGEGAERTIRPVLLRWSERSRRGLLTGLAYAAQLEGAGFSVRFATALPAVLGLATLSRLEADGTRLEGRRRPKLSRGELRSCVTRTALCSIARRGPRRLAAWRARPRGKPSPPRA